MPLTNAEKRQRRRDRYDALVRRAEEWLRQERGARSEAQWHAERVEALQRDALARQAERALQRKLALNLVNIGYKTLVGRTDTGELARLDRVRKLLQKVVTA